MDVVRLFRSTREWITPVLQESAFTERGVLTPEEFARAGDQLVLKCPTWSWQSGERSKIKPYLPADKQFLLIRGCPSHQRVATMNAATVEDYSVGSDLSAVNDKDGDWCAPKIIENSYDDEVLIDAKDFFGEDGDLDFSATSTSLTAVTLPESTIGIVPSNKKHNSDSSTASKGSAKEVPLKSSQVEVEKAFREKLNVDVYEDMEDESLALDESATTSNMRSNVVIESSSSSTMGRTESALLRSRRYDVSITYDKYYQASMTSKVQMKGLHQTFSPKMKPFPLTTYSHS